MRTFLVNFEKYNTMEDIKNGALGYKSAKSILVQCEDESYIGNEIENFKTKEPEYQGFNCIGVQDWNELQQALTFANINWLFSER